MVGASNAFNQVIEKDLDALMSRTKNRPIPSGRMSPSTALIIAVIMTLLGVITLYILNPKTAMFGAISIFMYTSLYTPLKTKTPLAVFVGALPGAIPFMLGWVAATNNFGIEPGTLFMIQFFWQFPHFWALAWMLDEDYKKAGFKMLPTGNKDKGTAVQIIMYTDLDDHHFCDPCIWDHRKTFNCLSRRLLLFFYMGMVMLVFAFRLFEKRDNASAKKLMLASVSYISLMQVVYVADKFI